MVSTFIKVFLSVWELEKIFLISGVLLCDLKKWLHHITLKWTLVRHNKEMESNSAPGKTKTMLRAVLSLAVRWKRLFLWKRGPCSIWFMLICTLISLQFIHLFFFSLCIFPSQVCFLEAYIFSSPFTCQFLPPQSFPCRFIEEYKWNPLLLLTCIKCLHLKGDLWKYSHREDAKPQSP